MTNKILEEFIGSIHDYINYWDNQKGYSSHEKLTGLAHSMLCMLDGVSGSFNGNIETIAKECSDIMLHDHLGET